MLQIRRPSLDAHRSAALKASHIEAFRHQNTHFLLGARGVFEPAVALLPSCPQAGERCARAGNYQAG